MRVTFSEKAFSQYVEWQTEDKKTLKRINELIKSIQRDGFLQGIGKPEPLRHRKGCSRRIDEANRLAYTGDAEQNVVILSCKGHYEE